MGVRAPLPRHSPFPRPGLSPGPSRLPLRTVLEAPEPPRPRADCSRRPGFRAHRPGPPRSRPAPQWRGQRTRASRLPADADSAGTPAGALPPRTATHLGPRRPGGPRLRRLCWLGQCLRAEGRADSAAPRTHGPRKRPPPARPPRCGPPRRLRPPLGGFLSLRQGEGPRPPTSPPPVGHRPPPGPPRRRPDPPPGAGPGSPSAGS